MIADTKSKSSKKTNLTKIYTLLAAFLPIAQPGYSLERTFGLIITTNHHL
jgi:hypothetical protein